ncbi:TPA: hypothetical protein PSW86_002081 [Staphylococcus aureus]|nr:hypothetical protein [Staphylococcus aureus]
MNKTKYQINSDNIKSNSEETSAISSISYEIENANNNDLNNASIQTQIEILKSQNSFPKNLSYLKSYTDPKTGTTTSAFLNKDTGKVTLGMSNDIKHIVVYNPAPLAIKDVSGLYADQEELKKLIEKYDGHIVRFVSDEDELDAGVRNHLYETAGEKIVLKNGEGHAMSGILMSRTQAIILAELNKVKGYQDENNKALKSVRKQTRHRLHKVETLRANWIQTTGGSLSSSQQQLLEALTALTIAEGLNQLVNEESQHLKKMYHAMAHKFGDNWKKAQEVGNEIGEKITSEEVIDELRKGGAYESKLETDPKRKIDDKIKKLNDVYKNCNGYIAKIKQSIEAIVSNDQMLASQIDGMM